MSVQPPPFQPGDALVLIDVQVDFCPGGRLAIPEGDRVVAVLNRWIAAARHANVPVFYTRDWHPLRHPSFGDEGGDWPAHCVQDTPGAAFHPLLEVPDDAVIVSKGTRFDQDQLDAFDQTGFEVLLRAEGVRRLWLGGLALDVCVLLTAEGALRRGFAVNVIEEGCRPVTDEGGEEARARLLAAGAALV